MELMKIRRHLLAAPVLSALLIASAGVSKATLIGEVHFAGSVEVTATTLDFYPRIPGPGLNGTGVVTALSGVNTGVYAGLELGDLRTIVDRDVAGGVVPPQPAGMPISVPNWLTFTALPGIVFDLTFISPGSGSAAACAPPSIDQEVCTPDAPGILTSPYNLKNERNPDGSFKSSATFSVAGIVRNVVTNEQANFNGTFSATSNRPFESYLPTILAGGSQSFGYDAVLTVEESVPEPSAGMMVAIGAGMLVFPGLLRRRRS